MRCIPIWTYGLSKSFVLFNITVVCVFFGLIIWDLGVDTHGKRWLVFDLDKNIFKLLLCYSCILFSETVWQTDWTVVSRGEIRLTKFNRHSQLQPVTLCSFTYIRSKSCYYPLLARQFSRCYGTVTLSTTVPKSPTTYHGTIYVTNLRIQICKQNIQSKVTFSIHTKQLYPIHDLLRYISDLTAHVLLRFYTLARICLS